MLVCTIIVTVIVWKARSKKKVVAMSPTSTDDVPKATTTVVDISQVQANQVPEGPVLAAEVPQPELEVTYKGTVGTEQMDILVNGTVILSEAAVPTTDTTTKLTIPKELLPLQTLQVYFKNDDGPRNILFSVIKLAGVDIKDKFVLPGMAEGWRTDAVRQGIYYWSGKYGYTV